MTLTTRIACFAGTFMSALLAMFVVGPGPFGQIGPTAVATLALLCALPMVDSALMGRSVHPALGGAVLGWPLGFFVRQAQVSSELAAGGGRIVAAAFVLSLALGGLRWYRSRRQKV